MLQIEAEEAEHKSESKTGREIRLDGVIMGDKEYFWSIGRGLSGMEGISRRGHGKRVSDRRHGEQRLHAAKMEFTPLRTA